MVLCGLLLRLSFLKELLLLFSLSLFLLPSASPALHRVSGSGDEEANPPHHAGSESWLSQQRAAWSDQREEGLFDDECIVRAYSDVSDGKAAVAVQRVE